MLMLITVLMITMVIASYNQENDIDECTEQGVCPGNAECENNQGGFSCNCVDGYKGDYCSDINECNNRRNICHQNADCINTDGSYTCSCNEGFYGNGDWCFPGQCLDRYCPQNQKCISATTTGCECKDGFEFNNSSVCEDIDECEQNTCDDQAECLNTIGSYTCQDIFSTVESADTTSGGSSFTAEMLTTQAIIITPYKNESDIDECTEKTHDCSPDANCTNTVSSFICTCTQGNSYN